MTIASTLFNTFAVADAFLESLKIMDSYELSKDELTITHKYKDKSMLFFNQHNINSNMPYSMTQTNTVSNNMTIADTLFNTFTVANAFQEPVTASYYSKNRLISTHIYSDKSKLNFNHLTDKVCAPHSMNQDFNSNPVIDVILELKNEKARVVTLAKAAVAVLKQNEKLELKIKELKKQLKVSKIKNSIRIFN